MDSTMPTSRSSVRSSISVNENNKHSLFLQSWEVFETSAVEMFENNIKIINNPDNFHALISKSSTTFANFFQTVSRLCGNILTIKPGRKQGLVSGASAIRSSYAPFSLSWTKLTDDLEHQYLHIYRQISVEFENTLLPMKSFITQNLNQYNNSTTQLLSLFSELKKTIEIIFQSEEYLHQGSQYFSEITSNISVILANIPDLPIDQQNSFMSSLDILFRAAITFLMNYHSLLSSKNQFQEILDEYVSRLELQVETSRSAVPSHPPPLSSLQSSREMMSKSPPSSYEIKYLGGTTLDEVISNGQKVIGTEQQSHRLFFDDLYKFANFLRKISEENSRFRKINSLIFEKEEPDDEDVKELKERLKRVRYNEKKIYDLEKQLDSLINKENKAQRENKEYEEENKRLSRINTEQNDRFNNFIGKMADLIGTEPSEEKLLAKMDQTRNNKACLCMNQFLFGSKEEKYLGSFNALSAQFASLRKELIVLSNSSETSSHSEILNNLKEVSKQNKEIITSKRKEDQKPSENTQDAANYSKFKNSIVSILKSANKNVQQNITMSEIVTILSEICQASTNEYSTSYLNKTFTSVVDLIDVSSKTVPSVYLPEVCYYFMLMYQSINYLKKFTSDMDEVFDKFEFKLPIKGTAEYDNLKHCSNQLAKHLHEIEPSSMHSVVFHAISRFIILVEAFVSNL
ncbi:hypothetical protein TVAG_247930 [Trichomonas vaginalis G3]|uniref:Uncharacterized protein n=1 Tax=Trichomonas vaginalis (strain ATCC PRA-98 / G3) TaxID=412133 RepID=A2FRE8_TRIV3|nr:WD40 repeat-containing protein [Trichomonas vaginalis G3]EAX92512.1 hypothetical protein TVAG_247930 [Trichomonas vaginalis G3]KAI5540780.1 WD40 repeat-containing protein [Trichomonas vaginalis G3]|eukprot:XP_001305442.1 hypothetical protein [Trichomonas vaginalis G3]